MMFCMLVIGIGIGGLGMMCIMSCLQINRIKEYEKEIQGKKECKQDL